MGLDGKTAAVYPGEFVEHYELHIRYYQMNNRVADFFQWHAAV